jgi:Fe-S oxidoreductase
MTYHDPCYLGRHNGIFDEPREALAKVPGLELIEMPDHGRTVSAAAGAAAGSGWKRSRGTIFRHPGGTGHRVGAEVLATACPYCIATILRTAGYHGC